MARLLDVIVATSLLLLLGPSVLVIYAALALNKRPVTAGLQRFSLDKLPLLFQVLQGTLTIREWWASIPLY